MGETPLNLFKNWNSLLSENVYAPRTFEVSVLGWNRYESGDDGKFS